MRTASGRNNKMKMKRRNEENAVKGEIGKMMGDKIGKANNEKEN